MVEDEILDIFIGVEGNLYVVEVLLFEKIFSKENYDDLNDFIVCK